MPELHPTNILVDTVESFLRKPLERLIFWAVTGSLIYAIPKIMANPVFMSSVARYLKLRPGCSRLCAEQELECARQIAEFQFQAIQGDVTHLYLEGTLSPLGVHARRVGHQVTYLDAHNAYFRRAEINDSITNCEQRLREEEWVKRIDATPALSKSLLIVGSDHVENKWGLIDKLREKGIRACPVTECSAITRYNLYTQPISAE